MLKLARHPHSAFEDLGLVKLGIGHSCDERSDHGGGSDSVPECQQVAIQLTTV